jgi:hypothetical protein
MAKGWGEEPCDGLRPAEGDVPTPVANIPESSDEFPMKFECCARLSWNFLANFREFPFHDVRA